MKGGGRRVKGTPDGVKTVGAFFEIGQEVSGCDGTGGVAKSFRQTKDVFAEKDAALELAAAHVGKKHQQVAGGRDDAVAADRQCLVLEPYD